MRKLEKMAIVRQTEIATSVFELVLTGNLVSTMLQAGQFVNIKINEVSEPLLRRPISICNIDYKNLELTVIYRTEGNGTTLLSQKKCGEFVDILGPLGTGFDLSEVTKNQTVLLVGGGIGVPPMYETAKRLSESGINVISVLGFRSSSDVFYEEKFKTYGDVYVATMDGTHGFEGNVVELIQSQNLDFDVLFACGPKVMLRALDETFKDSKQGYLSFEERMACGIGACYACVCDLNNGKMARVCKEGPVFKLGEVSYHE